MEPISSFMVLVSNKRGETELEVKADGMHRVGFAENLELGGGQKLNGHIHSVERPTVPGFPLRLELRPKGDVEADFKGIMHQVAESQWKVIRMELFVAADP